LGAVVIGRNEGERLVRCLESVVGFVGACVYVDSGSTDGSPARARELGARVVDLDSSRPFTAARARNTGLEELTRLLPDLEFVQFVDGDSELLPGWLETAADHLEEHPDVSIVSGELRERDPDRSVYNRLADLEWRTPPGEVQTVGGNAMMRTRALLAVGGYDAGMIGGEEPELCLRVRSAGHRIVHLDRKMGVHDAGAINFGQWWRRSVRNGHACAEIAHLQGRHSEPYWVRRITSIAVWGGLVPAVILLAAWPAPGLSLCLLGLLGVMWGRIYLGQRRSGARMGDAALYASHCLLVKVAECPGVILFAWNRLLRRRATRPIEHKTP
jgi:glycosyltransferase involved in cell wall biosynthesis